MAAAALLSVSTGSAPAAAQTPEAVPSMTAGAAIDPPAPVEPATISRDAEGRVTLRAVPLEQPLRIDGALDEDFYRSVPPISGFIQTNPNPGRAGERADRSLAGL